MLCVEGILTYWHTLQLPFLGRMVLEEGSGYICGSHGGSVEHLALQLEKGCVFWKLGCRKTGEVRLCSVCVQLQG